MPNILEMIDKFLNLKFAGELTVEVVCFRLVLAIILGGIVGYEREKNNRPAGFRTHILVCFGAAGSIMKEKGETVGGLTTAAGIWATACVGLGIGWGFYNIAIVAILFMIIIMVSLKRVESKFVKKSRLLKFEVKFFDSDDFANGLIEAYEIFRQKSIKISEIDKYQDEGIVTFTVSMKGRNNISDVVVSLSSIKNVEYVRDV